MADCEVRFPIDLVYCWCDDTDRVWREKRLAAAAKCGIGLGGAANGDCRYADNDDLRHSLRSVALYAPWIRQIFIVIDDDARSPSWLKTGDRVRIVRHGEIMPASIIPCFDSMIIEHYLAAIPGLSEHFLYANDDMMFNCSTGPEFFFAADGYPICRYGGKRAPVESKSTRTPYMTAVAKAEDLLKDRFGLHGQFAKAYRMPPHHNIDAYLRSDYEACAREFARDIEAASAFPFRGEHDVERTLYMGYALCVGHGHYRQARRGVSLNRPWYKRLLRPGYADSLHPSSCQWCRTEAFLNLFRPKLMCFNDGSGVTDLERSWLKGYYAKRFPDKSCFEN